MYGENGLKKLVHVATVGVIEDWELAWCYFPFEDGFLESGHELPGDVYTDKYYAQFDAMDIGGCF